MKKKPTESQRHAAVLIKIAVALESLEESCARIESHLQWLRAQVDKLARRL